MKPEVCPHSRREAIAIAGFDDATLLSAVERIDERSPDEVKELYYGAIAPLVESVVSLTTAKQLVPQTINNFIAFDSAVSDQLTLNVGHALHMPSLQVRVAASEQILQRLSSRRHIPHTSLFNALEGGCHTAGMAIGYHLQHFNAYLEAPQATERTSVLARSVGTLIAHASLHGEQQGIVDYIRYEGVEPTVVPSANGKAVQYDIPHHDIVLTDKAHAHLVLNTGGIGQPGAETVGDIEGGDAIIGCPILFKPKQMQQLWAWSIAEAVRYGLVEAA